MAFQKHRVDIKPLHGAWKDFLTAEGVRSFFAPLHVLEFYDPKDATSAVSKCVRCTVLCCIALFSFCRASGVLMFYVQAQVVFDSAESAQKAVQHSGKSLKRTQVSVALHV